MMQNMALYPAATFNSSGFFTAYILYQPDLVSNLNSSLSSLIAYEPSLNFCLKMYNTTVTKGVVDKEIICTQSLETNYDVGYNAHDDSSTFSIPADGFNISIGGDVYGVSPNVVEAFCVSLSGGGQTFQGECFLLPPNYSTIFCDNTISPLFSDAFASTDPLSNITGLWTSLATSITNT